MQTTTVTSGFWVSFVHVEQGLRSRGAGISISRAKPGSVQWVSQRTATSGRRVVTSGIAGMEGTTGRETEGKQGIINTELSLPTKAVDDKLLEVVNSSSDPVRQIVLLTDGSDTRPYRLNWPSPSVIYDIAPEHTYDATLRKITAFGLKFPKSCMLQHVAHDFTQDDQEDEDWGQKLSRVGYSGERPSVWVLEMPNELSDRCLQKILPVASSLLMKSSVFMGVIPVPSFSTSEEKFKTSLRKLFANNGFFVEFQFRGEATTKQAQPVFLEFIARQQRLSDAQVEMARMQMMQAEECGDEDGFEDAW